MRPLAEALAARGFAVRVPLLAGHGTDLADLARTTWPDWFRSAETAFAALAAEVPRVAVGGLSMGSLLTLHLAATRRAAVAAVICCATPIAFVDRRTRLLPLVAWIPAVRRRLALMPKRGGPDLSDPVARAASKSYRATPLVAAEELLRLRGAVVSELTWITQPALLLHGRHDHTVPVRSMRWLRFRLASRDVETHVLERSWHVLTADVDRDEVGRLAGDFLERIERAGAAG